MSNLQIFKNEEFGEIRTMEINGEPWLVGKDVAKALGYENPTKTIRDHVMDEDKMMGVQNVTPSVIDSIGRLQYPTWINESGVYSLIFGSKLPKAKEFKHWVTSEVLPSIRKHGAYMTPSTLEQAILSPDFLMRLAQKLKEEQTLRMRAEAEREALAEQARLDRPKVISQIPFLRPRIPFLSERWRNYNGLLVKTTGEKTS